MEQNKNNGNVMKSSIRRAYLEKRNKEIQENKAFQKNDNFKDKRNYILQKSNSKDNLLLSRPKIEQNKNKNHQNNLENIGILQKELNDLEKEVKLISSEIYKEKKEERILIKDCDKILRDIDKQKTELNKLKEINNKKNREFLQLRNHHRELMIRNIRSIHRDTVNELHRHSLQRFFERLAVLSRMRRENNHNPLLTNEQIAALPISYYPRNNNSNESCVLCGFPFCYNDVIIKLHRCNHIFHKACLTQALTLNRAPLCPTCNTSIF